MGDHGRVKIIQSAGQYDSELKSAGDNLVVVDWFTTWCGPCKYIAPIYAQLSNKYPNVSFLKVDAERLEDLSMKSGVRAFPTFHFIKNGRKIDELTGADPSRLEELIKKHGAGSFGGSGQRLGATPAGAIPSPSTAQPSAGAGVDSAGSGDVGEVFLATLVDMGFDVEKARYALTKTGGQSLEAAIDWISTHADEPVPAGGAAAANADRPTLKLLSEEERAHQEQLIQQRLEELRRKKAEEEEKKEREREINRRTQGQEALKAKQEWEDQQRQREIETLKRQKEQERIHREQVRKQIELDRLEREAKLNPQKAAAAATATVAPVATHTAASSGPKTFTDCVLQIRLADGQAVRMNFNPKDKIKDVKDYIDETYVHGAYKFDLMTSFPNRTYTSKDDHLTLADADLCPRASVIVQKRGPVKQAHSATAFDPQPQWGGDGGNEDNDE